MNNTCQICGIKNLDDVSVFTDVEISDFVERVFNNEITTQNLDLKLYNDASELMVKYFDEGYKDGVKDDTYDEIIENIYVFNAAKQYQCVGEIGGLDKTNKEIFLSESIKIFNKYYTRFFSVELDTCDATGIAVKKWFEFANAEG